MLCGIAKFKALVDVINVLIEIHCALFLKRYALIIPIMT